jgi:hypothetical protein
MRKSAPALGLAWVFLAVSYLAWLALFSIYRYLSVFELLAPAMIFSSLLLFRRSRADLPILLIALISTQFLVSYNRTQSSWEFDAHTDSVLGDLPADAMVVIEGYEPVAYTALWLDDAIPMVRIRANLMNTTRPEHRLHAHAQQIVRNHPGSFYLLLSRVDAGEAFVAEDLAWVGLTLDDAPPCQPVFVSPELQEYQKLVLCPLRRSAASRSQAGL